MPLLLPPGERYMDNNQPNFRHSLGAEAKAKVTGLTGTITMRSQALYGCNRYLIQGKVDKDGKVPEAWWVDEEDITVTAPNAVTAPRNERGGPMSKHY